ncbi:MAG TPA: hypothetical protein VF503_21430 [Sphingobium sp.]|uniref:hypothetical protein n=1 Tax=Sphingobium sp. TaxID=1912891 RepID=UPI002ED035FA
MPLLPSTSPWVLSSRATGPFGSNSDFPPPSGSGTLQQPLPTPPPSVTKKASIWDKDHVSETLLGIGQAFLSNQNFGEGLGAAAGVMAKGQQTLRDDAKKTVTYGGPDNQFEISADRNGNRTIRRVPEFAKAAQEERDAKNAMGAKDMRAAQASVIYHINKLPPEQRQAAYAKVIANPQQFGIDARGLPSAWDDTYGTVMGNSGQTVAQDRSGDRGDFVANSRAQNAAAQTELAGLRLELARQKEARAASTARLPKPPPSVTRKSGKLPTGFILD